MTEEELDSLATRWHADAQAPQTLKRHSGSAPRQTRRWMPVLALAASGLVAVGVVSLSSRPLPAFAQVEQNLKAIHTAQWEEEYTTYDEKGKVESHVITDIFVRRSPAAFLRRIRKQAYQGVVQTPTKNGAFQILITDEGMQSFEPRENKIVLIKYVGDTKQRGIQIVTGQINYGLVSPGEKVDRSKVKWNTKTVEGLLLFERARQGRRGMIQERFWTDPKTLQIVRSEVVQTSQKPYYHHSVTRCQKIRYNPALSDDAFRLVTPADARVVNERERFTRPASLSEQDKNGVSELMKATLSAWNRGDADKFSTYWDFAFRNRNEVAGAQPAAMREKQWRIRTRNQVKWAEPLRGAKIKGLAWTNSLEGSLLPQGEVLSVETEDVRFLISQQTGQWKVLSMTYNLKPRKK